MFVSGFEVKKFATGDQIKDFICNMGNIMIPYATASVGKDTIFSSDHYQKN